MLPKNRDILMGRLSMDLYLKNLRWKYKKANRREKGILLAEFCEHSGYHKKHAIRLLNQESRRRKAPVVQRGRPDKYPSADYLEPLKRLWLSTEQICGKRLKEAIPMWLPHYKSAYETLPEALYQGLLEMSASTIDRLLKPCKIKMKRGLSGTKPGRILKKHIPIKTNQWNETQPGFLEADTVAHCGTSLEGSFAWSLTMTDIYSQWTEMRAVWNKGATGVVEQIRDIENNLPFEILGFDSDNGSEFLNWHLMRYFSPEERKRPIQFTRSRPYHSDDNAHVEQKNWTHVRQLFGYERFGKQSLIALMNDLYKNEVSLMNNYFLPNTKLKEKQRVEAKIFKKHEKPKTPYQRLLESEHMSQEKKDELTAVYNELNPFDLQRKIKFKLNRIFGLLGVSGQKMGYK